MRKRRYSVLKSDAGSSSPRFLCAVQLLYSKGSGRHFSGTLPVRVADESLRHPWLPTRLGAGTRLPIRPPLYSCLHSSLRASVASPPALPLVVSVGRSHKTTMASPKVPPVTHSLLFIISSIAAGTALFQDAVLNPVSCFHFTRQHPPYPRPAQGNLARAVPARRDKDHQERQVTVPPSSTIANATSSGKRYDTRIWTVVRATKLATSIVTVTITTPPMTSTSAGLTTVHATTTSPVQPTTTPSREQKSSLPVKLEDEMIGLPSDFGK